MHQKGENLIAQGHTSRQLLKVLGFLSHSVFLGVMAEQGCMRLVRGENYNLKTIRSMEGSKNTGYHVSWVELG